MSVALDVNTLLYSSDDTSPFHNRAVTFLKERATGAEVLCLAWPTVMGYLRIATRVKELQETWEIQSLREDVVGPDGLFHKSVARYVLLGKRKDLPPAQQSLDLGAA